jgi:hypothetical protein
MFIRMTCPNGHRLKIVGDLIGRVARCPTCQAPLTVPQPKAREMSDTSVLAVLGEYRADKSVVTRPQASPPPAAGGGPNKPMRTCPKCRAQMSAAVRICPKCKLYQPDKLATTAAIPRHCPLCGQPSLPAATQCTGCGGVFKAA